MGAATKQPRQAMIGPRKANQESQAISMRARLGLSALEEDFVMKKGTSRRKFLSETATRVGVVAGAAVISAPANAAPGKSRHSKKVITRPGQPLAPGAVYSPGIQLGDLIFVSGQVPMDPATRKLVRGPFAEQVRQCLENIKSVVEAAGSALDRVLKCNVYLSDMENFQAMNEVYLTYFPSNLPARTTLAVKGIPLESPIEIECIAYSS